MIIKFWGVRGSIPRPGPKTIKYGGNTACIEAQCGDSLIIFDAGTGIVELGEDLMRRRSSSPTDDRKIAGHIFISHFHWDHIEGFPFFVPFYIPDNEFDIYGIPQLEKTINTTLHNQMAGPNFPITVDDLGATLRFHDLESGDTIEIGRTKVIVGELNHPGGCLCYRLECDDKVFVYASDNEHCVERDPALIEFVRNADVIIYDGMYAPEQYLGKWDNISRESWGHSTWEAAVSIAEAADIKHLVLFHHGNEDSIIDEMQASAREKFPNTTAAYEGLEIKL